MKNTHTQKPHTQPHHFLPCLKGSCIPSEGSLTCLKACRTACYCEKCRKGSYALCLQFTDLSEGLQHFLALREVSEEQLQGPGHQGGVVVHHQVKQNAQEQLAPLTVQVQLGRLRAADSQGKEVCKFGTSSTSVCQQVEEHQQTYCCPLAPPPHPPTFPSLPSSDGSGQNQLPVRCDRNPFTFILTNKSLRHRQTWITRFSSACMNMYSPGCCPLVHVHPSHSEPGSSGKQPPRGQDQPKRAMRSYLPPKMSSACVAMLSRSKPPVKTPTCLSDDTTSRKRQS